MNDNFIHIKFSRSNLHNYWIRTAILKAIKENLSRFDGKMLDIGCGGMPYKEWILNNSDVTDYVGLDIESAIVYDQLIKPDFTWDGVTMPFNAESFNCAIGTEVLEHCPKPEIVLAEVHKVLKPGGVFFFTVPFLWNLHETPHDEYRYTPFALERLLKEAGFDDVEIYATGGWHASMAQMIGLYVKRAKINKVMRRLLEYCCLILLRILYRLARKEEVTFTEGQMITGLYGVCRKK